MFYILFVPCSVYGRRPCHLLSTSLGRPQIKSFFLDTIGREIKTRVKIGLPLSVLRRQGSLPKIEHGQRTYKTIIQSYIKWNNFSLEKKIFRFSLWFWFRDRLKKLPSYFMTVFKYFSRIYSSCTV